MSELIGGRNMVRKINLRRKDIDRYRKGHLVTST